MKVLSALLLFGVLALASARTVTWTGGAGNSLWNFATNWDGNAVPSKNDDVVINPVGGATITISAPAYAASIVIGGGSFRQTLNLLSSLDVGAGGITIKGQGILQLSSNNDLPLTTQGNVIAGAGGSIIFTSGDIQGPGQYVIDFGGYIEFSGSALKMIEAADVIIHGTATIQPTTIQLAKGATLTNGGDTTAVGQINIFSTDNSQASFYSYGNFSYNGGSNIALTFQLATYFAADFTIVSGTVVVQGPFHSAADITLPVGTVLTIQSGEELKTFKNIMGSGTVNVAGVAEVDGIVSVSRVTISDSGSLTLNNTSVTKSLSVGGKLILNTNVTLSATDVSVVAGTVTGQGQLIASGNFEIAVSPNGNANSFISTVVQIQGTGYTTGAVTVLLSDNANVWIHRNATFTVTTASSFEKQTGNPVITNNGAFSIRLAAGSKFHSTVDFVGSYGNITITAGDATFEGDKINTTSLTLGAAASATFRTSTVLVWGPVLGTGKLNISAAPDTDSLLGDLNLSYFGVDAGNVRVNSVKTTVLEVYNGALYLGIGSANTATTFNFYGGIVKGSAKVSSTSVVVGGDIPQTLDGVVINTQRFTLRAGNPQGTFLTYNGAQINSGN